jgi:hypothetical protein
VSCSRAPEWPLRGAEVAWWMLHNEAGWLKIRSTTCLAGLTCPLCFKNNSVIFSTTLSDPVVLGSQTQLGSCAQVENDTTPKNWNTRCWAQNNGTTIIYPTLSKRTKRAQGTETPKILVRSPDKMRIYAISYGNALDFRHPYHQTNYILNVCLTP